jgi:hypothetical protein
MTKDDIIRMAREAGSIDSEDVIETVYVAFAAAERERLKWDGIHSCGNDCQRPACVQGREQRARIYEECIDLVAMYGGPVDLEAAIRARGTK